MGSSTRAGLSPTWRQVRVPQPPPAGIGSANCKPAFTRANGLLPPMPHRKRNNFSGHRSPISRRLSTISTRRLRERRVAIWPRPRNGPSIWKRWPHLKQIALWADNCPVTFANRAALVGAELARLEQRELDAERLYEEAIHSAREHGFVQNEGLTHELAARFYAARGFETIAHAYLRNAWHCYL